MSQSYDARTGVIHDIGYRTYTGPRESNGAIARSLFGTGLFNAYGVGRSGKSKSLPVAMTIFAVLPAVIMVGVMVMVKLGDGFIDYSSYPNQVMLFTLIFAAAQAPVLFSRDIASGAIVLYLARPLGVKAYALVRWLSLFAALLIFIVFPVLVLYIGALAAEAPVWEHTKNFLAAVVGMVISAAMLASITGVVSAWTKRRGLAVGGAVVALLVSTGIATGLKGMAESTGRQSLGEYAGLLSPFTLTDGIQAKFLDGTAAYPMPPESVAMGLLYLLVAALVIAGGIALLFRRYRRLG